MKKRRLSTISFLSALGLGLALVCFGVMPSMAEAKTATDIMAEISAKIKGGKLNLSKAPGLSTFLSGASELLSSPLSSAKVEAGVLHGNISVRKKSAKFMVWPVDYEAVVKDGEAPSFYVVIMAKGDMALDALAQPSVKGVEFLNGLSFADPMMTIWKGEDETFSVGDAPDLVKAEMARIKLGDDDEIVFREGINMTTLLRIADSSALNTLLSHIKIDNEDRLLNGWVDLNGLASLLNGTKPKGENVAFTLSAGLGNFKPVNWLKSNTSTLTISSAGGTKGVVASVFGEAAMDVTTPSGKKNILVETEVSYDLSEKETVLRAEFDKDEKAGTLQKLIGVPFLKSKDTALQVTFKKGETTMAAIEGSIIIGGGAMPIDMEFPLSKDTFKIPGIGFKMGDMSFASLAEKLASLSKKRPSKDDVKRAGSILGSGLKGLFVFVSPEKTTLTATVGDADLTIMMLKDDSVVNTYLFVDIQKSFEFDELIPANAPGRELVAGVTLEPPLLVFGPRKRRFSLQLEEGDEDADLTKALSDKIIAMSGTEDPAEEVFVGSGITMISGAPFAVSPGVKKIDEIITLKMHERALVTGSIGGGLAKYMSVGSGSGEKGFSFSVPAKEFSPFPRKLQKKTGVDLFKVANPRLMMALSTSDGDISFSFGVGGDTTIDMGAKKPVQMQLAFEVDVDPEATGLSIEMITENKDDDDKVETIEGLFGLSWLDLENLTVGGVIGPEELSGVFRGAALIGRKAYGLTVKASESGLAALRFEADSWHMTDVATIAQVIVLNGEERINLDEIPQFSLMPLANPSDAIKAKPGFKKDKVVLSYVAPLAGDDKLGLEPGVHFYGGLEFYGMALGDAYGSADENGFYMEGKSGSAQMGPVEFRDNEVYVDVPFELGTVPEIRIKGQTPKILGTAGEMEMIFAYDNKAKGIVARASNNIEVLGNYKATNEISSLLAQKVSSSTFGFKATMEQSYQDAISNKIKDEITKGLGNLDGEYQKALKDLEKANEALNEKEIELEIQKEKIREEIARAKRPITNARNKVSSLSSRISSLKSDISYYKDKAEDKAKKLDFIGAIDAAARMSAKAIELAGTEAAYHSARAVLKALEDSFNFIPVESHPLVLAKLTEVQVARIGVKAATAIVEAAQNVNSAMDDVLNAIVSAALEDAYNIKRMSIAGDLSEALDGGNALTMQIDATVLGGDMALEVGFKPQDPVYTAEQVAGATVQIANAIIYQKKLDHGVSDSQRQAWQDEIKQATLGYEPLMNRAGFSQTNRADQAPFQSVFMFMDDQYIDYDFTNGKQRNGYPKRIDKDWLKTDMKAIRQTMKASASKIFQSAAWKNSGISKSMTVDDMPQTGAMADAAVRVREDRVYFFKDALYFRFDLLPRVGWQLTKSGLIKDWPGLWQAINKIGEKKQTFAFGGTAKSKAKMESADPLGMKQNIANATAGVKLAEKAVAVSKDSQGKKIAQKDHAYRKLQLNEAERLNKLAEMQQKTSGAWNVDAAYYWGGGVGNNLRAYDGIAKDDYKSPIPDMGSIPTMGGGSKQDGFIYFFVRDHVIIYNLSKAKVNSVKTIKEVFNGLWSRNIDAAITDPGNRNLVYMFSGDEYVGVAKNISRTTSEPKKIKAGWTMSPDFSGGGNPANDGGDSKAAFDAAVRIGDNLHPYIFKGNKVVQFNYTFKRMGLDHPKLMKADWPGVFEDMDAAVRAVNKDDLIWFFRGDQYQEFSTKHKKVLGGGPIAKRWPALWQAIAKHGGKVDAAYRNRNNKNEIIFYVNEHYIKLVGGKIDPPRKINSGGHDGLWNAGISASFGGPGNDVWYFKGNQTALHDWSKGRVARGFPVKTMDHWTGIPRQFVDMDSETLKKLPIEKRVNLASTGSNPRVTVWQSSNYKNAYPPENAVDGKMDTMNHTNNGLNEGYYIDLGGVYKIDEVVLFNRQDNNKTWSRMNDVEVMVSDWPMTAAGWLPRKGDNVTRRKITKAKNVNSVLVAKTGRYIGIRQTRKDYLHMAEVHVIGKKQVVKPQSKRAAVNLTTGKKVRQSSQYKKLDASYAFDADINTFSHTSNTPNAWLEVDLGAVYKIDTVVLENRRDSSKARLNDALVYVSDWPMDDYVYANSTDKSVHVLGKVGAAKDRTIIEVGKTGRYVRVQLPGAAPAPEYLNLAELGVYGQPKPVSSTTQKPNKTARAAMLKPATYQLMSAASYKCVDATGNTANGAPTHVWHCDAGSQNQKFNLEYVKPGFFMLRNTKSKRCLTFDKAKANSDGPVVQWNCGDAPSQLWKRYDLTKGWFALVSALDGSYCLMADGSGADAGTPLVVSKCNAKTAGQVFALWDGGPKAGGVVWDKPGLRRIAGMGTDITITADGTAYLISDARATYGGKNVYRRKVGEGWVKINPLKEPTGSSGGYADTAPRIASSGNHVWAISPKGSVLKLGRNGQWEAQQKLSQIGLDYAIDVGVAPDGVPYVITSKGAVLKLGQYAWAQYRAAVYNENPIRITVDSKGVVWLVKRNGDIIRGKVKLSGKAIDVAANNGNTVYVLGTNNKPYWWNGKTWVLQPGESGANLAIDPKHKPWFTQTDNRIMGWPQ